MKLIRAYKIFRFLPDLSGFISRSKFRTDRGIYYIKQSHTRFFVNTTLGHIAHHVLNERFGNTGINAIHTHVITIVGSPSQGKFRKVTGPYNNSAQFITQIHENLCSFASLCIFISHIMHGNVVSYIFKMLLNCICNANFPYCHTKTSHQGNGITISPICSTEAWHRHADNILTVHP